MRKSFLCIMTLLFVFIIFGCKEKTKQQRIDEFRASLTAEDSTQMLKICDDAMAQLKNGEIEKVIANLYSYNVEEEDVEPLTEEQKNNFRRTMKLFPPLRYNRVYYSFMLGECNDVKYAITFDTVNVATTAFMFNPVKVDGQWILTIKDTKDDVDSLRAQI